MKNIFKYIYLAAVSALTMTACSEDGPDYAGPGEASDAPGVVFASSAASAYTLTPSESVLNIPLTRTNAQSAGSYDIKVVTNEDDAFEIPAQVSFAAGEKTALLPVNLASSFEIGTTKQLEISLSESLKSPYTNGNSLLSTKVTRDYVWNDLGVAYFDEGFLGVRLESHLFQRSDDASYYRLEYPYNEDAYIEGEAEDMIGGTTQEFIEFTVNDGKVTWEQWYTGLLYDGTAGQDIIAFQPTFLNETLNDDNTVVEFNEDGTISYITFSPYYYIPGLGGFGEIEGVLYFPGYEFPEEPAEEEEVGKDFAVGAAFSDYLGTYEMTYNGKVTEVVTITDNGDGTATLASFDEGVSFVVEYFGGLLYLGSQKVVIPGLEEYNFSLYPSDGDAIYDDVYLYAGFDEEGVLKFKNYPYNVTSQEDGSLAPAPEMNCFYIYDLEAGAYGKYSDLTLVKKEANKSASIKKANYKKRFTNAKNLGKVSGKMIR